MRSNYRLSALLTSHYSSLKRESRGWKSYTKECVHDPVRVSFTTKGVKLHSKIYFTPYEWNIDMKYRFIKNELSLFCVPREVHPSYKLVRLIVFFLLALRASPVVQTFWHNTCTWFNVNFIPLWLRYHSRREADE